MKIRIDREQFSKSLIRIDEILKELKEIKEILPVITGVNIDEVWGNLKEVEGGCVTEEVVLKDQFLNYRERTEGVRDYNEKIRVRIKEYLSGIRLKLHLIECEDNRIILN